MNILLIEDELKTAKYIAKGLRESGFVVDVANDGADGLHLLRTESFDAVILDVMLPTVDGWSIIKDLRKSDRYTPTLMLTACDELDNRVKGLRLGADDYLVKPFAFSELLARLHAIMRRTSNTPAEENVQIGNIVISLLKQTVLINDKPVHLTPKEYRLLVLLARNKNKCLSRSIISEKVWGLNFDTDTNVVDVAIRRLRLKLGCDEQHQIIKTVRGSGYMISAQ